MRRRRRQARKIARSRLMAHQMTRVEWVLALMRSGDIHDPGWTNYLRRWAGAFPSDAIAHLR